MSAKIILCLLACFVSTNAINVKVFHFHPKIAEVGVSVDMRCQTDVAYEYCIWKHLDRVCNFEWKNKVGNITMQVCSALQDRVQFIGDYKQRECGIRLHNVTMRDAGEWACEIEAYVWGPLRGYVATGRRNLTIIPKQTTTYSTKTVSEDHFDTSSTPAGNQFVTSSIAPENQFDDESIPSETIHEESSSIRNDEAMIPEDHEENRNEEESTELGSGEIPSPRNDEISDLDDDSPLEPAPESLGVMGIVLTVLSLIVVAIVLATVFVVFKNKSKSVRLDETLSREEEKKDVELEKILNEDTSKVVFNGPSSVQFSDENKRVYQNIP